MEGYCDFARFYDILQQEVDYREIADFYCVKIHEMGGKKDGVLLDLACGTGSLSVLFAQKGYDVVGVDASDQMLSAALNKPHDNIRYLCQSMEELDLPVMADVTVCALDSINHLPDLEAISAAFQRVWRFTNPGGVFLFDINTPYKHREILGDNAFVFDYDELYAVWQNELDQEDELCRVDMYLDFFAKEKGLYRRYEDFLSEIAPAPELICEMLKQCGFTEISACGYLTGEAPHERSDKLLIAAKRPS